MLQLISFYVIFLSAWKLSGVHSFCDQFPYGHTCRNIDLTAFCLQVSQLVKIRNSETPARPYYQFEKIFDRLQTSAQADKPFVHFGGYKQPNHWPCIEKKCSDSATSKPGETATSSSCPPPSPCHFVQGPATEEETTKPGYAGCDKDCVCCKEPPKEDTATGTIFSLQDGCELKYLKAPIERGGQIINSIKVDSDAKENPYTLSISEISVNKVRLHNWLHITIASSGKNPFSTDSDLGSGNIKMAFLIAHDAMGFPVGEFVSTLPCGSQCNCEERNTPHEKICHQATYQDHIPCMFDGRKVITNTGMLMVYAEDDTKGKGLREIHASWRFSQSASPDHFITELHFRALVVDDFETIKMPMQDSDNSRLGGMSERPMTKEGVFGWNPVYTILHPSRNTIGGWDYFRDVFTKNDVNCHQPISAAHYTEEPYPTSGQKIRKVNSGNVAAKEHCYRLDDKFQPNPPLENINFCYPFSSQSSIHERSPVRCPGVRTRVEPWFIDTYGFTSAGKVDLEQVYPWTLYGGRTEAYVIRDGGLDKDDWKIFNDKPANIKLYWGIEPEGNANELDYAECEGSRRNKYGAARNHQYPTKSQGYDKQGKYGHFCTAEGTGRRVLNLNTPIDKWPNTLATIWKFPGVGAGSFDADRCYCPKLLATPDPRFREPPEVQVQGRRQHAYQMIISWNCIIPFGFFVSRYYKETYSKVFFLQEYWWYTIHVLCMVTSAIFTFGGIYVMELKRVDAINWEDHNITAHVIIGFAVILLFGFQVLTGFIRVRNIKKRILNIFMHWFLGVLEYLMAIACMINSSFILLSGMTCSGVVALGLLVVFQIMFYASMEVHMRNVDKVLKLDPPRSYLPPPIMRVFHKDAPDSKFRIYVLIAYFILCVSSALIQFSTMDSNALGESCFLKSGKYSSEEDV